PSPNILQPHRLATSATRPPPKTPVLSRLSPYLFLRIPRITRRPPFRRRPSRRGWFRPVGPTKSSRHRHPKRPRYQGKYPTEFWVSAPGGVSQGVTVDAPGR